MTTDSKIEWTDHTFSPWLGCTPISAACDHCYAAAMGKRFGWPAYQAGVPRRRTAAANWKAPLRWQRQAAAAGKRLRVFPSLCDPFDSEVPHDWQTDFLDLVEATPDLDWLLLTKRPKLAGEAFSFREFGAPANVALGVTAENQAMADLRIPQLLAIPGVRLRFLSIEPMLGPVDLRSLPGPTPTVKLDALAGRMGVLRLVHDAAIGWIIAGGESGAGARPTHPAWIRSLRDQCAAAGVPFFFKQWGEWAPSEVVTVDQPVKGRIDPESVGDPKHWPVDEFNGPVMFNVGKAAGGAELDGEIIRELPAQLQVPT
jgi:protein gp37